MMRKKAGIGKRLLSFLLAAAVIVTAQEMPAVAESASDVTRPTYNAITDTTAWSYVYFGSYPQTEVTGAALTSDIIHAKYTGSEAGISGDAWVNGVKYRRISKAGVNNDGYFGDAQYRYFEWEPIKWRVLNLYYQSGERTLSLVADQGIDCKIYSSMLLLDTICWRTSSLREWLNNGFYQTAFNMDERKSIIEQSVSGDGTYDNIYLLSVDEAKEQSYGFCGDYAISSASRKMKVSDYANARGSYISAQTGSEGNCWWWLRTTGGEENTATRVTPEGSVEVSGYLADTIYGTVVPALKVQLEKKSGWNPKYSVGADTTDWSYVSFGSYPQTEVDWQEDEDLFLELENTNWDGSGNAQIGNVKYHRVAKEDVTDSSYFGDAAYRYFKWEPIRWRILQQEESRLFLMTDDILDCKEYSYQDSANGEHDFGDWVDKSFYNIAFNEKEKSAIQNLLPLLSYHESYQQKYGLGASGRCLSASEYAYRIGMGGESSWWLRKNSDGDYDYVDKYGAYQVGEEDICRGVVPVLYVDASSDCWTVIDDTPEEERSQPLQVVNNTQTLEKKEGESADFSVDISGGHPSGYTFQWYFAPSSQAEGTKIDGATSSNYRLDRITTAMSGSYYCVVTSGRYPVTSDRTNLTVTSSPGTGNTAITEISLDKKELSLKAGGKGELTASVKPSDAQTAIVWKSSDEKTVKVSVSGTKAIITAVQPGKATVTAQAGGKTASCIVTVMSGGTGGTGNTGGTGSTGNTGGTGSTTSTPKPAAPKPAAPSGLIVKLSSANAVKLSWKKVKGASGYYVYRAASSKGKFKKIGTTKKTSFINKKLKSGKIYYYKVAAYKNKITGTQTKAVSKKILGKLSTPKMKLSNKASQQKITISWNKIKNASNIEIWRKVDRNGKYKKWRTVSAKKGKATYSYRSYTRGHNYFFQIRAYYTKDKVKVYSGYSNGLGIPL